MSVVIKNCSVYKFLALIIPRWFVITRKIKFDYKMFLLYSFTLSSVQKYFKWLFQLIKNCVAIQTTFQMGAILAFHLRGPGSVQGTICGIGGGNWTKVQVSLSAFCAPTNNQLFSIIILEICDWPDQPVCYHVLCLHMGLHDWPDTYPDSGWKSLVLNVRWNKTETILEIKDLKWYNKRLKTFITLF